jgi:hypothetical protein
MEGGGSPVEQDFFGGIFHQSLVASNLHQNHIMMVLSTCTICVVIEPCGNPWIFAMIGMLQPEEFV